jgi:uncharacterized protein YndB with AHSA1/START domain
MNTFSTSRTIPAEPAVIFSAFSDPKKLARWWGPSGFSNTFNTFQFATGGSWSFVMHGPDGTDYINESEFTQIIQNEKIVIRHRSQPVFTLTVTIRDSGKGSVIQWVQVFDSAEIAKSVAHIVEPANEQNLDRLTAELCPL